MSTHGFTGDAKRAGGAEITPAAPRASAHAQAVSLRSALGNRALQRLAALRRMCECGGSSEASCGCDVEKNVRDGLSTPSHPMEPQLRRTMESHFGHDFGGVRIHTGDGAARSAHNLQAEAYTVGRDIVFGHGAYNPRTLAHELTHVMQQGDDATIPTRLGDPHDPLEHEADAAASSVSRDEGGALRRTPAKQVSCGDKNEFVLADGTKIVNPVQIITDAETLANQWLDDAIALLTDAIDTVSSGKPPIFPHISDGISRGVRLFGLDPELAKTWTGSGMGTARLLRRRLELIRSTIGAGSFYFMCLPGPAKRKVGGWEGTVCSNPGTHAASRAGTFTIVLCPRFWKPTADDRAGTIVHESSHNFAAFISHLLPGRQNNAFCYERLVSELAGKTLSGVAASCTD